MVNHFEKGRPKPNSLNDRKSAIQFFSESIFEICMSRFDFLKTYSFLYFLKKLIFSITQDFDREIHPKHKGLAKEL